MASAPQSSTTQLEALQTFALLKAQIISIATALYGTHATHPTTAFDVITYTTTANPPSSSSSIPIPTSPSPHTPPQEGNIHAIALITYITPPSHTTWELLSHIEHQPSPVAAAGKMLADLRIGMGDVMADLQAKGAYTVQHSTIPDLAGASVGTSSNGNGGRRRRESSSRETWEDEDDSTATATDGCYNDKKDGGDWHQDFGFDGGSSSTLASIPEEYEE